MINSRFFGLAVVGGLAAALAIACRPRQAEKRQLDESLRTWEDEGGNLAPSTNRPVAPPAVTP